ncbi:MAG: DUF2237 domain-containing protein [Candidatus Omnitrophica bacterium]|nr:DUF2237 domain-containing protein [Candidatus Omnitrophota bacterium]
MTEQKNVLGTRLQPCCKFPMTGFYRDGYCRTGPEDFGRHTVCVRINEEFLSFSKAVGNDLSTPHPEMDFPGLIPGDQWCVCVLRWKEAYEAGMAPQVVLEATHEAALAHVPLDWLQEHAVDQNQQI